MNSTPDTESSNSYEPNSKPLSDYHAYYLVRGLRYINYAFIIFTVTLAFLILQDGFIDPELANPISYVAIIIALVVGAIGLIYALKGNDAKTPTIIFCVLGMLVAPLNLIILIVVLRKTTLLLKKAGYKVGLIGAKR